MSSERRTDSEVQASATTQEEHEDGNTSHSSESGQEQEEREAFWDRNSFSEGNP